MGGLTLGREFCRVWDMPYRRCYCLLALIVAGILALGAKDAAAADSIRIAVKTFEAAGVEQSLAVAIKPLLTNELQKSSHIVVIEETRLDDALGYMRLQQSG